jgi:DNA-binding NtrC family response regulator
VGLCLAVEDSLEILRCSQAAADESAVLASTCATIKSRLGAAAVGFYGARGTVASIVSEGRLDADIAERVVALGQVIAPHRVAERIEGGAPVRYAGETIGALVGRWTLSSVYDASRSASVLAVAAAVAGPAVAAALSQQNAPADADDFLGSSPAIHEVRRWIERAAAAPFAVLICGESGSGKELVARALHRRGPRRTKPFCALNCAALPEDLVESELFGHVRGAFTGAAAERAGVFEDAHGGTLFLDEVGELSPRAQAKLLRVIQEGEIRRVGENISRRVDVRIVAATNRNLSNEASAGRFRLDLLYRLDVVHIALPPLRDRRDDIAPLADRYWREAADRVGSRASLASTTLAALARYDWPGNVRELQNVLAALAVRSAKRGVVLPTALPPMFGAGPPAVSWRIDSARRTFDEQFVRAALARNGGHRIRAASELGVSRQGLAKLMTRLGITERCPDSCSDASCSRSRCSSALRRSYFS